MQCGKIAKKVFWEFDFYITQNVSDILPLFRTPTWPSHHISERQENDCSNAEKQSNYTCGILFGASFDVVFETTTTRSHSRKSFFVRLHDMKSIRSDLVKGTAHILQRDQHGLFAKHLTYCEVLFQCDVFFATAVVGS